MAILIGLIFTTTWPAFLFAGSIGGAALGGIWTCNRHMLAILAPPHKTAEIYGFGGLTVKFAGVFGPIGYGWLAFRIGEEAGLLYLLLFLVFAFFLLHQRVRTA